MIIDTEKIEGVAKGARPLGSRGVDKILLKASHLRGLSLEESAALLAVDSPGLVQKICNKAGEIKERIFGKRIVLFVPLYISNFCTNNCVYCGFRRDNKSASRKTLTMKEIIHEARAIEQMGFRRILVVSGEDPNVSNIDYLVSAIKTIYEETAIRIVHINAAPTSVKDLSRLKIAGAGVYQSFQETYHIPTYASIHPSGRKKDYDYRITVMDRAMEAGFKDVGIGSLLGLYDYRFDVLATIAHSLYLYDRYGTHAHTISIPRLMPAKGSAMTSVPLKVSDSDFKKIVAVYRLAVPSAGLVVSTRESAQLRDKIVNVGASQISAGSRTEPGGYNTGRVNGNAAKDKGGLEQFSTSDHRRINEVISSLIEQGLMPSLCTTCYRVGRTGKEFTRITLRGDMGKFCNANAILSLQEYLMDNVTNGVEESCLNAIRKAIRDIGNKRLKGEVIAKIEEIKRGKRDIYL